MEKIKITKKFATRLFIKLLSACKMKWVDENFTEKNFSLEPITADESDWEVCVHHFKYYTYYFSAIKKIKKNPNYQLCGPRRAMEYIAHRRNLRNPLIMTTHWWNSGGECWGIPIIGRSWDYNRIINLAYISKGEDADFPPEYGWLVLKRKKSS